MLGPSRVEQLHHVGASAEGAHRKSAADHLPERREVGPYREELLRPAHRQTEGHDLVQDEQHAVCRRRLPQPGEEGTFGGNHSRGAEHRLDDHGRELVSTPRNKVAGALEIVERSHQHLAGEPGREPGPFRTPLRPRWGLRAGIDAHLHRVVRPVIAAFHLQDLGASGERSGGADRVEHGFGPRVGEPESLDRRDPAGDRFS